MVYIHDTASSFKIYAFETQFLNKDFWKTARVKILHGVFRQTRSKIICRVCCSLVCYSHHIGTRWSMRWQFGMFYEQQNKTFSMYSREQRGYIKTKWIFWMKISICMMKQKFYWTNHLERDLIRNIKMDPRMASLPPMYLRHL